MLLQRSKKVLVEDTPDGTRRLWLGGILCGTALTVAAFLQQFGMDQGTQAGKAGFITALYIVLVPIAGFLLKKKVSLPVWISVGIAIVGLYLLCISDAFTVALSDIWLLLCAVCFTIQIMFIDKFAPGVDCIRLSCVQFLTQFVLSLILAFVAGENPQWSDLTDNLWPILYLGFISSGVGYTLQTVAQKGTNPAVTSLLMSMEAVFSVILSALILGERMSGREYLGCAVMFAAVLLSQSEGLFSKKKD